MTKSNLNNSAEVIRGSTPLIQEKIPLENKTEISRLKQFEATITKAKHLNLFAERAKNTQRTYNNVYWLLTKPYTFINAYGNISRNKKIQRERVDYPRNRWENDIWFQ